MKGVNRVTLIGHLGKDPEMRATAGGKPVANFSLACNEAWKGRNGEKQEHTEWVNVVCFEKLAEIVRDYLTKGSGVYLEGKLRTRKWEDKQGVTKYTTEVIADQCVMLGDGGKGTKREPARKEPEQDDFDDLGDIPF